MTTRHDMEIHSFRRRSADALEGILLQLVIIAERMEIMLDREALTEADLGVVHVPEGYHRITVRYDEDGGIEDVLDSPIVGDCPDARCVKEAGHDGLHMNRGGEWA